MVNVLKVGIVGLGTVGAATLKNLSDNAQLIEQRAGVRIEIAGIHARNRKAKRDIDVSAYPWFDEVTALIDASDLVVELIGGADGAAYQLIEQALSAGKHVVTANKALIAHHGYALALLAEQNKVSLLYEAAVAGSIPAVKAVCQSFAANRIEAVYGIMNGTCNYILTQMRETGRDFNDVLKEAQVKGYAEADPTFDIEGVDAGHKIAILAALAFGQKPNLSGVSMTGISHLNADDFKFSQELGYKIKLLAIARIVDGSVLQVVEPCLVPVSSPFAAIENAYNAVLIQCDRAGTPLLTGLGAGGDATASAVVGDIIDVARGICLPVFGVPASSLKEPSALDPLETVGRYYIRLSVQDKAGVLADIATILRDHQVSVDSLLQHGRGKGQDVSMVIETHEVAQENLTDAITLISRLDVVSGDICTMRVEDSL